MFPGGAPDRKGTREMFRKGEENGEGSKIKR